MYSTDHIKQSLANIPIKEALYWLSENVENAALSTAFGNESQIITHIIATEKLPIRVFTIDTGRLFEETYQLMHTTQKNFGITLEVYFPNAESIQHYASHNGVNAFYDSVENRKACCYIRKVEPLSRALKNTSVWITGLRAAHSENRASMPMIEWDDRFKIIKYNPLLHWSDEEVKAYIKRHQIPTNPLLQKGFTSIGCSPCTRAVLAGESNRAGRWWWENGNKECGLHTKISTKGQELISA